MRREVLSNKDFFFVLFCGNYSLLRNHKKKKLKKINNKTNFQLWNLFMKTFHCQCWILFVWKVEIVLKKAFCAKKSELKNNLNILMMKMKISWCFVILIYFFIFLSVSFFNICGAFEIREHILEWFLGSYLNLKKVVKNWKILFYLLNQGSKYKPAMHIHLPVLLINNAFIKCIIKEKPFYVAKSSQFFVRTKKKMLAYEWGNNLRTLCKRKKNAKSSVCMQILLYMLLWGCFLPQNQREHLKMSSNILYGLLRAATHGTNNNKNMLFST